MAPRPHRVLTSGVFRLGVGHSTPTIQTIGTSKLTPLGKVLDTRPDEAPPDPELAARLGAVPCADGATLTVQQPYGAPIGAVALQLWIAAFDRFPDLGTVAALHAAWPSDGTPTEELAGSILSWLDLTAPLDAYQTWRAGVAARAHNALEVLCYTAAPGGAVIDLSELAGEARYILAAFRSVSILRQDANGSHDDLDGVDVPLFWQIRRGRPARSSHRDRWVHTSAVTGGSGPTDATIFDDPTHRKASVTPPIGGACSWNCAASDDTDNVNAGLEHQAGGIVLERAVATWSAPSWGVTAQTLTKPVAGSLAWSFTADNGPRAALLTVQVTR